MKRAPANNKMQRTSHGPNGGSPLISVFCGQAGGVSRKARRRLWARMSARRCLAIGLAAVVVSGSSRSVAAEDPVAAVESAAAAAAATPEGKKYEEEVATAFGRDHGKSIQTCAREVKRPDLSDFQVFVRVSAAGQVEEALVKPSSNLADCVRAKLTPWKLGVPPRPDQWVRIQVKLKRK